MSAAFHGGDVETMARTGRLPRRRRSPLLRDAAVLSISSGRVATASPGVFTRAVTDHVWVREFSRYSITVSTVAGVPLQLVPCDSGVFNKLYEPFRLFRHTEGRARDQRRTLR